MIGLNVECRMLNIGSGHRKRSVREEDEEMRPILKLVYPTFDIRHSTFVVLQQ